MDRAAETGTRRRQFLKYVASAAAGVALGAGAGLVQLSSLSSCEVSTETMTLTETVARTLRETLVYPSSLRAAAEPRGLLVGSEVEDAAPGDKRFEQTLAKEFNFLTVPMSWGSIDQGGYGTADTLVRFASNREMKVKGHVLISHRNLPEWVTPQISPEVLRQQTQKHIRENVSRYRGKVYAWDVVNEAVETDGLRKSILFEKLGEEYIADAFRVAHDADPNALLFYNDYDAEAMGGSWKAKSDLVYALVRKLLADGVPIHGVGLQMHLFAVEYPKPEDIAANVRRLAALGLKVTISEMDVRIKELPMDMPARLEMQRRIYHDVIAACMKEEGFIGVTFWGFTDAHSWINEAGQGPDYPLLFDENYQPKPAYWGVMDALLGV